MKKIAFLLTLFSFWLPSFTMACDVCDANQPDILKGITHGTGPEGNFDYIIIWSGVLIVSITLFLSIKYLAAPHRYDSTDIKNIVLE